MAVIPETRKPIGRITFICYCHQTSTI
jgi:hypothetical protein